MKYNLTKCNNLRWECGTEEDRHNGFCRVFKHCETGEEIIALIEIKNTPHGLPREFNYALMNTNNMDEYVSLAKFRIVPRDPETYTDWQVGDVVAIDEFDEIDLQVVVAARINDIVICKYISEDMVFGMFTCAELKKKGNLVLTDYEKGLNSKSDCEFDCKFISGDIVLVRNADTEKWKASIFKYITPESHFPFTHTMDNNEVYKQCIPYNEKTWRLLGTTDEYEKDE